MVSFAPGCRGCLDVGSLGTFPGIAEPGGSMHPSGSAGGGAGVLGVMVGLVDQTLAHS